MEVKTIAVIGAGAVGRGIAYLAMRSGFRTILEDISADRLDQGVAWIREGLEALAAQNKLTQEQKQCALDQLTILRSIEDACREADLLIEAAPEDLEVKLEIFTLFDKFSKPHAILASNTPSFSIADLAAITFRPEDCIGMRFQDPTADAALLEIIRAPGTSDSAVAACLEVGRRMGRKIIVFSERPSKSV